MFRSLCKTALMLVAVLAVFPAAAGERYSDNRFERHRGFTNGLLLGKRTHWANGLRFTRGDIGIRGNVSHYRPRMRLLKHFGYPATSRSGRNNIIVVASPPQAYDSNGIYGSSYAYQTDGGTYVGGDSGYWVAEPERQLAPKAKVIDIAVADDPCAYEANVCVIRP